MMIIIIIIPARINKIKYFNNRYVSMYYQIVDISDNLIRHSLMDFSRKPLSRRLYKYRILKHRTRSVKTIEILKQDYVDN